MPGHAPELAGHLGGRGLAVGAGDSGDMRGNRREEARGDLGKGAARVGIGDMHCALDLRTGRCDDGDRTCGDGIGDEILAVETGTGKGTEHGAGRNLAVIDGKSGDNPRRIVAGKTRSQFTQFHCTSLLPTLKIPASSMFRRIRCNPLHRGACV